MRAEWMMSGLVVALAAFTPTGASAYTAYVSNEKGNTVSVIDLDKMAVTATVPVGERPRGIIMSGDNKQVYICTSDADHIEVLDTDTLQVTRTLNSGPDPELFTLAPDGKTLYVANEDNNMVTVLDVGSGDVASEIPVGTEPEGMGVSPDGKWLVNTSETTSMAHFIDHQLAGGGGQRAGRYPAALRPFHPPMDRGSGCPPEVGGTVAVIDVATRKILHKIAFAVQGLRKETIQPVGIVITPDGKTAFVALGPGNRVAVIDNREFRGEGLPAGRPKGLAARFDTRCQAAAQRQRRIQRRLGH